MARRHLAHADRLAERLARVRAAIDRLEVEALVITHLPHLFYLTNLRASAGILVVTRSGGVLIVDFRYRTAVATLFGTEHGPDGIDVVDVEGSYEETLGHVVRGAGWGRVGLEAEHISVHRWQWLDRSVDAVLVATDAVIEEARMVKDDHEIETLRTGGGMIAGMVGTVLESVRAGRSEDAIAAEIDLALRDAGFERPAFETIVAGGPNSALPHAQPTGRVLTDGDLVVLDFGGVHHGYCVDLTRTVCIGSVGAEPARLHRAVADAHLAALRVIRPGTVVSRVDAAARAALAGHGLDDAFGHSTGHGLGIEVHELPRIGRAPAAMCGASPTADVNLAPGMVFTVEPGVYVPGVGGVRIEDDVLVTADGYEMLTDAPRQLAVR